MQRPLSVKTVTGAAGGTGHAFPMHLISLSVHHRGHIASALVFSFVIVFHSINVVYVHSTCFLSLGLAMSLIWRL